MDRAPNPWDRFYRYQVAPWRGERPVAELLPLLGDGPVLELGCGNGKLLGPLVKAGVDVIGLDISYNVLNRLGTGVLADVASLPFSDRSFGAILDFHCTGHLLDQPRAGAMAEIVRCLKPDGHLISERLGRQDLRAENGAVAGSHARQLEDGRITCFSSEESLRTELEAAGLRVQSCIARQYSQKVHGGRAPREAVQAAAVKPTG